MSGEQHQIVGIGTGIAGSMLAISLGDSFSAVAIALGSAISCWWPDMDHDRTKLGRKRKVITETTSKLLNYGLAFAIAFGLAFIYLMWKGLVESSIDMNTIVYVIGASAIILFFKIKIERSEEFHWAAKHRGLMHTLVPLIPIALLFRVSTFVIWDRLVLGFIVGYLSHLLSDCTTTEGCPLFYPLAKFNFRVPIFNTEEKMAKGCWVLAVLPNILVILLNVYII